MVRRFLRAFKYAWSGMRFAWAEELNFRIEVLCAFSAMALGFLLNLSPVELGIVILASSLVLAAEIFNTALEDLCDKVNRESDPAIAAIKDLCAAAVLVTCIGALIIGVIIFLPHIIPLLHPYAGRVVALDSNIELAFVGARSPLLTVLFSNLTLLGDGGIVLLLAAAASTALFIARRREYILGLLLSVAGSTVTTWIIKLIVARPRPNGLIALYTEQLYSFPSGHATASVALYGFLIYLFWKILPRTYGRMIIAILNLLIILAVGFSRLYLGVHFPADVLAGYLVGGLWVVISIGITELRIF